MPQLSPLEIDFSFGLFKMCSKNPSIICGCLIDQSQLNRRTRAAMKSGRNVRASYLAVSHHRRRLARRREIRRLVEGPVSANR